MTTFTSREFSRGSGRARRATHYGPVFITDRGKPAYVLLGIDDYNRLAGVRTRIADLLFMPGGLRRWSLIFQRERICPDRSMLDERRR